MVGVVEAGRRQVGKLLEHRHLVVVLVGLLGVLVRLLGQAVVHVEKSGAQDVQHVIGVVQVGAEDARVVAVGQRHVGCDVLPQQTHAVVAVAAVGARKLLKAGQVRIL